MRDVTTIGLSAVLGLSLFPALGVRVADAQAGVDLSAQHILARTATVYAHCTSYRDTGVVTIVYQESIGRRTEERPFKTAFVRPDRFRFEYEETSFLGAKRRYIVWRLAGRVRTWWDVKPGIEEQKSLGSALSAATGVSGGSAHAIPTLLLPEEVGGRRVTEMTDPRRVADAKLGEANCYRVEGNYAGRPMTVWVDQKTLLVRRIEFEERFPNFRTQQTTTYEPVIDEPVAPGLLEFHPPSQK